MLSATERKIIATIAYYDELDYPLTAFEVWKHLTNIDGEIGADKKQIDFGEIISILESKNIAGFIEQFRGFYFMKGRSELVEKCLRRNKVSSLKLKKLRRIAWILRCLPFVRMIAVTGRLAMKNSDKKSDWDIFVTLKKGRIWTGRTIFTIFVHLIGRRRYGNKIKDRICLNYFISDESFGIKTEKRPFEINLFSANEYSFMIPLFGFRKFRRFQIRNSWIKKFKPNYEIPEVKSAKVVPDTHFSKIFRRCAEKLIDFDFLEKFLERLEMKKIIKNPKTSQEGSIVEASCDALVFLPEPQGKEIYERCREKLIALGVYY
jgi:hypothetical protein